MPELLTTQRQQSERERTTSLLFREGRADEALAIKRADGTARLITGDHAQVVEGIAALWQERRAAHADDPDYTISVSAPTNRDARAISAAIRAHRRAAGELGPDQAVVSATDQAGERFDLTLAVGDRVRLFARTNAAHADRGRGIIGNNGSVLAVTGIDAKGVTLRNAQGREGRVAWDTLRDRGNGRIRLSYGDVLSIDATQGLTSTEHIEAMPSGTQAVNAYKAYTAASRHRVATFLVTSDGAERREIAARRPLGDARPIREADVWVNMGRNLSRQPKMEGALEFLEQAREVRRGAIAALQTGLQPIEQREAEGLPGTTLAQRLQHRRLGAGFAQAVAQLTDWVQAQAELLQDRTRLAPVLRAAVAQARQNAAARISQPPERVHEPPAELTVEQDWLLQRRMQEWWRETRFGLMFPSAAQEARWQERAKAEEAAQRATIAALPARELRQAIQRHQDADQADKQRQEARARGPSMGM